MAVIQLSQKLNGFLTTQGLVMEAGGAGHRLSPLRVRVVLALLYWDIALHLQQRWPLQPYPSQLSFHRYLRPVVEKKDTGNSSLTFPRLCWFLRNHKIPMVLLSVLLKEGKTAFSFYRGLCVFKLTPRTHSCHGWDVHVASTQTELVPFSFIIYGHH